MKQRTPPKTTNDAGEPRRIGIEIEFGGLDVDRAAGLVESVFGGDIVQKSAHIRAVENSDIGDFLIELDAQMVHANDDDDEHERKAKEIAGDISSAFVPTEIVGPPASLGSLAKFDELLDELRAAGAEGTDEGISYAFGMQLNPEASSLQAEDILNTLQSYVLMSPLLRRRIDVDPMRRALPYIDGFSRDYMRKILDPDYAPDIGDLIEDYLQDNPTRNRELDMLPLFAHLDEDRVRAKLDDPLIKARPTYHYRLPNTRLSDPDWGVVLEWNRWVSVERLSADDVRRRRLADEFLRLNPDDFFDQLKVWGTEWLKDIIE